MVKNKRKKLSLRPFKELWTEIPINPLIIEMEQARDWAKKIIKNVEEEIKSDTFLENDLIAKLSNFIEDEKLHVIFCKITDPEIWLETMDHAVSIICIFNNRAHFLSFDIYSSKLNKHLKMENIEDVEKIINVEEESNEWDIINDLEEVWLILDEIKLWGHHNQVKIKETIII